MILYISKGMHDSTHLSSKKLHVPKIQPWEIVCSFRISKDDLSLKDSGIRSLAVISDNSHCNCGRGIEDLRTSSTKQPTRTIPIRQYIQGEVLAGESFVSESPPF